MEVHAFRSQYQKVNDELSEVVGHLKTSSLEYFEQQTYTWKEECRTLTLRSREKESQYKAELMSVKSEMTTLVGEIVNLRAHISSGPHVDEALRAKYIQLPI